MVSDRQMVNVLIIAFNRPDFTFCLVQALLKVKPLKLFVALDGPRNNVNTDITKCNAVRNIVELSPWECDVKYLISNNNNGCNKNVEEAINWFFDNVEEGVILEDDCIPDISYFKFAFELLDRYRYDNKIYQISGMSMVPFEHSPQSYRFSKLVNIWGWATWRRAWKKLIDGVCIWPEIRAQGIMKCYGSEKEQQEQLIQESFEGKRPLSWGMKWRLTCLSNGAYSIIPKNNLIQNIGFNREDATSKKFYHPIANIEASSIDFPLVHPKKIIADISADERVLRFYYDNVKK